MWFTIGEELFETDFELLAAPPPVYVCPEREREEEGVYTVREVRGFVSSAYKEYLRPSSSSMIAA